jgi:hypothetical protein
MTSEIPSPAPPIAPKTEKEIFVSPAGNDTNDGLSAEKPWRTIKAVQSGWKVNVARLGTYASAGIHLGGVTDAIITAYGDPKASLPRLHADDGINLFSFDATSARIQISFIAADSNFDLAKTAGGIGYHAPKACFGNLKGADIGIDSVTLINLAEGVVLMGTQRVSIHSLAQADPLGLPARCVMIDDCQDLLIDSCFFANSINESPLRATDKGIVRGIIRNSRIGQVLDAAHGRATAKAAVTIRQALHLQFVDNVVTNAELSFNTDITGRQTISQSSIEGGLISGSHLTLRPGCSQISVSGLTIVNHTGSECVSDQAGNAGIFYEAVSMVGDNCGFKFYADSDAVIDPHCKWAPSRPGLPMVKADSHVTVYPGK